MDRPPLTEADLSVLEYEMRFLDFYLKDEDNGYTEQPPVKAFLMGENRWLDLDDWPVPDAVTQSWYLSWEDESGQLTPGSVTPIHLQMGHTAYVFPAGSRICLIITSSDFPRIQPHPNTMASPFSETRTIPARNSILHGDTTPSCLKLPIISIQ